MRSRIAITALLATGALMSGGGAALGVSALSTTTSAGGAQYGPVVTPRSPTAAVLGERQTKVAPSAKSTPTAAVEAARQVEQQGGSELPFTGYAAIPLLLGGVALLGSGAVLRRRTRDDQPDPA